MINQVELIYFIEIAKTQHVSRAAERLGVTQPALSHCLKRLEDSLGVSLFVRSKKGVKLTVAGQRLYKEAQLLLSHWQQIQEAVYNETNSAQGLIRLGCHSAVAQYALPQILQQMSAKYPEIKFNLVHDLSRKITESVISDNLDIGIVVNPIQHNDLVIKEICRDYIALWRPKKCTNNQLLIYDNNLLQAHDIIRKLEQKKIIYSNHMQSTSLEVIAQLLKAGIGSALLPKRVLDAFDIKNVERVEGAPIFNDRISVVYKHEFRKIKRGEVFLEAIQEKI